MVVHVLHEERRTTPVTSLRGVKRAEEGNPSDGSRLLSQALACAPQRWSIKEVYMRIATLSVFLLSALLMPAQEPVKIRKVPAQSTPASSGTRMFGEYCASCHGLDGKGGGPAAAALKVAPPDLTLLARENGGKYPDLVVLNTIQDGTGSAHGSKDMPVWGPIFHSLSPNGNPAVQQRITNLTTYIETLQVK